MLQRLKKLSKIKKKSFNNISVDKGLQNKIYNTMLKYCWLGFIWVVTLQDLVVKFWAAISTEVLGKYF